MLNMITYRPFWEFLKEKNISTYMLIYTYEEENIMNEDQPIISWQVTGRYTCYMLRANYDLEVLNDMQDTVSKLRYDVSGIDIDRFTASTIPDEVKSEIVSKFQKQKDEILRFCSYMEMELQNRKNEIYKDIPKLPLNVRDDEWINKFLDEEK